MSTALKLATTNARELASLVKRCEKDPNYPAEILARLKDRLAEAQAIVKELS